MKDVVLINPPCEWIDEDNPEEHLGLSYLAAYLEEAGFTVSIFEMTGEGAFQQKLHRLETAKIYGLSCFSTNLHFAVEIVRYIRETQPESLVFVGGIHATAKPEETLKITGANGVVAGEGEIIFAEIVKQVFSGQPSAGIFYGKPASGIFHSQPKTGIFYEKPVAGIFYGKPVTDLDTLPFPERKLVNRAHFSRKLNGEKCISMLTSRGCQSACLHCNSIIMGGGNKNVRFRSVENIIAEIRSLKQMGYHQIRFNDDNFAANPLLPELLHAIKKEQIGFRMTGRVEYLTEENCRLLKEAGCSMCSIGIESYHPDNLKFLGKHSMLKYFGQLAHAEKYGITIRASFMVGLPYDTDETIEYYFEEAGKHLKFNEFAVYPLIPYPGTPICENPEKYGYKIVHTDYEKYLQIGRNQLAVYALSFNNGKNRFTPDDVKRFHYKANAILNKYKTHMRDSRVDCTYAKPGLSTPQPFSLIPQSL
jgi:anaerobic magnesium-protoporphyrin IX monomethyl ester cyclase